MAIFTKPIPTVTFEKQISRGALSHLPAITLNEHNENTHMSIERALSVPQTIAKSITLSPLNGKKISKMNQQHRASLRAAGSSMQPQENYKTIQIRLPDFRNAISYPDIRGAPKTLI